MVSRACNVRFFWKSFSNRPRYSTFKHFRAFSASDEIVSSYAQPAIKLFHRMQSQRWNLFCICSASDEICSAFAQHILNVDFEMGWDFPLYWACAKIGYSVAEHAWKLVTHLLSMCENWLFKWHNLPEAWDGLRGWPTPENTGLQWHKLYIKL